VISVLIADDQDLVREGLRMLLEAEPDLAVAGEAADGRQALAQARLLDPDVILMDVRMPGMNGIEATTLLVQAGSRARILMLTTFNLDEYVYHALRAGASGFLLKDATREQLAGAVRAVSAGETLLAPAITQRLIEDFCRGPAPGRPAADAAGRLSERELDVVRLVAQGLSNAEIAARLYLSEATVKSHIARVLAKLGLRDRVQVAVYAYEHGIVRPGRGTPPAGRNTLQLRGRAGGGAGLLVVIPPAQRALPVQRDREVVALRQLVVPVLDGDAPQHLELDAARVLGVQRLGQPVVALPHQGAGVEQLLPGLDELGQRADLPGQVVEPHFRAAGGVARADVEQAKVVVVHGARGPQERGSAGNLHPDLEAERRGVELHLALQPVHVQHGVVQAADCHETLPVRFVMTFGIIER
jgi:DNA-binding NarL/FixJ family response regulator